MIFSESHWRLRALILEIFLRICSRRPGVDCTEREQKGRHRIIGHRNPQKETGLKNGGLHEGAGKAMTLKLSNWPVEHWLSKHVVLIAASNNQGILKERYHTS